MAPSHPTDNPTSAQSQPSVPSYDEAAARRRARVAKQVGNLFNRRHSGWHHRDAAGEMPYFLDVLERGGIKLRLARIPASVVKRAHAGPVYAIGRESEFHALHKAIGLRWMIGQRARDAEMEVDCFVGRADVYSRRLNWIVEVGNTPILKLMKAMMEPANHAGPVRLRFTLIPFQTTLTRAYKPRSIFAIDFSCDRVTSEEIWQGYWRRPYAPASSIQGGQG